MDELIPLHSPFSDISLQQSTSSLSHKSNEPFPISKSKLQSKPQAIPKHCSICSSHRRGRWTDEEHLKFLLTRTIEGDDINIISKSLKSRTKTQIRSHKQKIEAASDKPMRKKLREATSDLLNEKLNQAHEHLLHTKVPTSSSLFGIKSDLLEEFKSILGPKINTDYVITKEDIVYVGMALIKKEYDQIFETRPKQTKTPPIFDAPHYRPEDGIISNLEAEDSNLNSLIEKGPELMEEEIDSVIESHKRSFTTFSATHMDRSWIVDDKY